MMRVGLRIDGDTFRGTQRGVPYLCDLLGRYRIAATFFFSVGPDNMGRHLWRLVRPSFLVKMLRTKASSLYGWDILFKGTFWPGPRIGERLGGTMRAAAAAGHEVGLHAWDHHAWQARLDAMDGDAVRTHLDRGFRELERIVGRPPACSAAPAWKANDLVLREKSAYPFVYNSDCRGTSIFRPIVAGRQLPQPQIPVTLPTYDEAIGRGGVDDATYNEYLLSLLRPDGLNVLTIHAEVEGCARRELFERFIAMARSRGISFVPLGALLADGGHIGTCAIVPATIPGREGWVACQKAPT
jgi:undecaprenyl phosphate-alpha-L-ara4FN deformylase